MSNKIGATAANRFRKGHETEREGNGIARKGTAAEGEENGNAGGPICQGGGSQINDSGTEQGPIGGKSGAYRVVANANGSGKTKSGGGATRAEADDGTAEVADDDDGNVSNLTEKDMNFDLIPSSLPPIWIYIFVSPCFLFPTKNEKIIFFIGQSELDFGIHIQQIFHTV
jgi:hypothetical protein